MSCCLHHQLAVTTLRGQTAADAHATQQNVKATQRLNTALGTTLSVTNGALQHAPVDC
jgi:hypothetical protein